MMWKSIFSGGDEEPSEQQDILLDEPGGLCSLSPTQSLIVFAKPIKFALLFTFGNMFVVGSTAFLIGPGQQLRMMLDPVRIYATAIYVGCVVVALVCALWQLLTLQQSLFSQLGRQPTTQESGQNAGGAGTSGATISVATCFLSFIFELVKALILMDKTGRLWNLSSQSCLKIFSHNDYDDFL